MITLLLSLVLFASGPPPSPDPHPSCKAKPPCKVHYDKRAYTFDTVWVSKDGTAKIHVRCTVRWRKPTTCRVLRITG